MRGSQSSTQKKSKRQRANPIVAMCSFAASQVEEALENILRAFFINDKGVDELFEGPFAPLASLSAKAKTAFLLGLITKEELREADALRRVRNVFAHEADASFDSEKVKKIAAAVDVFAGAMCTRDSFLHLAINIVPPLLYRSTEIRRRRERPSKVRRGRREQQ
jgi:hypothetical protein